MTKVAEKGIAAAEAVFGKKEVAVVRESPRGLSGGDREDLVLPHLLLMQPMSKLVTNEGHKIGTYVNTLTKEVLESPTFTPVVFSKFYRLYRQNGTKMEYEAKVTDKNDARLAGKRWYADKVNPELKAEVETVMSYICLIKTAKGLQPIVIQFSKMSMNGGKKLYTLASLSRADLWANTYKLVSIKTSNERGTFFTKDVEPLGVTDAETLALADDLYSAFGDRAADVVDGTEADVPF